MVRLRVGEHMTTKQAGHRACGSSAGHSGSQVLVLPAPHPGLGKTGYRTLLHRGVPSHKGGFPWGLQALEGYSQEVIY